MRACKKQFFPHSSLSLFRYVRWLFTLTMVSFDGGYSRRSIVATCQHPIHAINRIRRSSCTNRTYRSRRRIWTGRLAISYHIALDIVSYVKSVRIIRLISVPTFLSLFLEFLASVRLIVPRIVPASVDEERGRNVSQARAFYARERDKSVCFVSAYRVCVQCRKVDVQWVS